MSSPRRSCTRPGFPVGLPMGQTSDAVDWVGASVQRPIGAVFIDAKDNIKINSDQTRQAMEVARKIDGSEPARGVRLGRRRQQPLAHFGQGLGHHEPAERLGGRQARQPEGGGAVLDALRCRKGPNGRFVGQLPQFYGLWKLLQEQAGRQGPFALHLAKGIGGAVGRGLERLRPAVVQDYVRSRHLEDSRAAASAPCMPTRRAATSETSMFGAPARSEVGAQMYNQAIDTVMISKFTQGKEKLDDVIKWAEKELEGTLRA